MKFNTLVYSKKFAQMTGVFILVCLLAYGVIAKVKPTSNILSNNGQVWQQGGSVKAKVSLSQNKVLQGSDGLVYLKLDLEALEDNNNVTTKRFPTDFVVVLDRSGSMSESKKMEYAHQAIASLLHQLKKGDRFALVTFDNISELPIPLTEVHGDNLPQILEQIKLVTPRGGTDLGSGLIKGMDILKNISKRSATKQRLLLISDGQANQGITTISELSKIASKAIGGEFVISTLGVGLSFNEKLMASIADSGTGNYYFLEDNSSMDSILAKEFHGASLVLAKNLQVELQLASGVKIMDASGYTVEQKGNSSIVRPGHLYYGQKKGLFLTLKLPTQNVYSEVLGTVKLSYEIQDKPYVLNLINSDITIASLPTTRRNEVDSSVDKDTFVQAWTKNNYGLFLKESSESISNGDILTTRKNIQGFKQKLEQAYAIAPSTEIAEKLKKLDDLEEEVKLSPGKPGEQKRLGKSFHFKGRDEQRSFKK